MTPGIRLLYLGDDPTLAGLAADALRDGGEDVELVTVRDPTAALDRLGDRRFDCVVSDCRVSGPTGTEFFGRFRRESPDVPFVRVDGEGGETVTGGAAPNGGTDHARGTGGAGRYELLAGRVRNALERHRGAHRVDEHERVGDAARRIDSVLDRAAPTAETERRACEILTGVGPYAVACIAGVDDDPTRLDVRTWAEADTDRLDGPDGRIEVGRLDRTAPTGRVLDDRRLTVVRDVLDDAQCESWREVAAEFGAVSLALVPLEYRHTLRGLLVVFAGRDSAFDVAERELLSKVGSDLADTLYGRERENGRERGNGRVRRQFEAILDSPDSLIGILDTDGTLRRPNRTAVEMVDADREELTGRPFWETPWWEHSEELQRRLRAWVERAAEGEHVRFEGTHPTTDGDDIVVDGVLRPVTDADGDVVSIIAEARDVSELEERERELAAQRARLEQLNRINETLRAVHRELVGATSREALESAICASLTGTDVYDGAWVGRYEPETGRIRPTAWVGIDDDHMRTLDVRADSSETDVGPAGRAVRTRTVDAIQDVATADRIAPWRDRLESLGIDSLAAIPIGHDGTVYGMVGVYASRPDVFGDDERGALDELGRAIGNAFDSIEMRNALERQNERLDEFARIVSHDLRNPLNVATGQLELAREDCDSDHLGEVADALDRSEALIDDFLTLSREGKSVEETRPVSLANLVTDCWRTVTTADASLVTATDLVVRADRSRLRQLFENLFRNAVEHGGTDVTITVGETADGFYVADDGPGITADERDEVFESGYSTAADGTGFGLSIVEDVAEGHGWEVSVGAAADGGARFEVTGAEPVTRE